MRQVAGSLRLDLAQYRALAAFAQFGSELDKSSAAQITRGSRMVEILKQGQYSPIPVEKQVLIIYAGTNGFLDDLPLEQCRAFEDGLYRFVESAHPGMLDTIRTKKALDDDLKAKMTGAVKEFKTRFVSEHQAVAPQGAQKAK
jgi:F-type H+-transporting ATPase subunit alpha